MKSFIISFLLLFSASLTTMAQVSPAHVVVGYWQDWGSTSDSPPYVPLRNIDSRYNVIDLAFATTGGDFATLSFAPNIGTVATMQSDIAFLQSQGRKVLLSVGGENGTLILTTAAQKQAFISSLEALLDQYNLDGFDLDLEGGTTLILDNGDNNFMSPTTPRVVNLISAVQQVVAYRQAKGRPCWFTMAPETFYVETAFANTYGPLVGAYLPIIYGLRNQLTFLQPQFYNTGSVTGLDGKNYNEATPDFTVAMAEMLMTGFAVNGLNGGTQVFPALRPDQVVIGLPSTQAAAPSGGFYSNAGVTQALNYLTKGQSFGGIYKLRNPAGYPGLRGVMNWSISYDQTTGYAFAANIYNFFNGAAPGNTPPTVSITSPAAGASLIAPATVTIKATAADADGTVAKVDFFNGTAQLGTSTTSPYTFTWNNVTAGSYTIIAVATDNGGASTTSASVSFTVKDTTTSGGGGTGNGNCTGVAAWSASTAYNGGAKVVYNGSLYTAKWWTQGEQPDISTGDGKPWQLVNACSGPTPPPDSTGTGGGSTGGGSDTTGTGGGTTGNCANIPAYQPYPAIYMKGDKVTYNGKLYQSTSDNLYNVTPGTADWWWTPLGSCTASVTNTSQSGLAAKLAATTDSRPLTVYPNPVSGAAIQLQLDAHYGERLSIDIVSVSGTAPVLHKEYVAAGEGTQLMTLDLGRLPAGLWIVRVKHPVSGREETTKIIKL